MILFDMVGPLACPLIISPLAMLGFLMRGGIDEEQAIFEHSPKADKTEFYSTVDLAGNNFDCLLTEWQHHYSWERLHSAHHGKSPLERYFDIAYETPFSDEVCEDYNPVTERIQDANYRVDLERQRLKRSL